MAHGDEKSGEDFRLSVDDNQLAEREGHNDLVPPFILYAPAVLAVSPDLRAKVVARKARNEEPLAAPQVNNTTKNSFFHILSSDAGVSKMSSDIRVDEN